MTRSQSKVSDTQVTVKACGPLVSCIFVLHQLLLGFLSLHSNFFYTFCTLTSVLFVGGFKLGAFSTPQSTAAPTAGKEIMMNTRGFPCPITYLLPNPVLMKTKLYTGNFFFLNKP